MDTEALHVALQQSFSPDASLRDPAEKAIKNLKNVKGSTASLLRVAAEKQVRRVPLLLSCKNMLIPETVRIVSSLDSHLTVRGEVCFWGTARILLSKRFTFASLHPLASPFPRSLKCYHGIGPI